MKITWNTDVNALADAKQEANRLGDVLIFQLSEAIKWLGEEPKVLDKLA